MSLSAWATQRPFFFWGGALLLFFLLLLFFSFLFRNFDSGSPPEIPPAPPRPPENTPAPPPGPPAPTPVEGSRSPARPGSGEDVSDGRQGISPAQIRPKNPTPLESQLVSPAQIDSGGNSTPSDHRVGEPPVEDRRSKGEQICCRVLEEIYGMPFSSHRPDFLRNPKSGRNLELDCFNPQVKVGVEYQGKQHYVYPNNYHKTEEQFWGQVDRDLMKVKLCENRGVHLITVPYNIPLKDIRNYILSRLPKEGGICPARRSPDV